MLSRKQIKDEYKLAPKPAGVFQIKNNANGKIFIGSSVNLDAIWNRHRFQLDAGLHPNKELQKDWTDYGTANFSFEILATQKPKDSPSFDMKKELDILEAMFTEELQPFGEKGYNPIKAAPPSR